MSAGSGGTTQRGKMGTEGKLSCRSDKTSIEATNDLCKKQLQYIEKTVLKQLTKHSKAGPFLAPVDVVTLGLHVSVFILSVVIDIVSNFNSAHT